MKRSNWLYALVGLFLGALLSYAALYLALRKRMSRDSIRHEIVVRPGSWQKLNLVLSEVEKMYVDDVDRDQVTEAAIEGALAALDPHSLYFTPEMLRQSEEDIQGNFDGIGIQFNVPSDTAVVLEVFSGGPSEDAGLQIGDRILQVDEVPIAGVKMPQDSIVRLIKGPSGTRVNLLVQRDQERIPFAITRGKIQVPAVDAAFMLDDAEAYVKIKTFSMQTFPEFVRALDTLQRQGMKRLIVDLRGNTGGLLDQCLRMADLFLPKGAMIVYTEGKHSPRQEHRSSGRGRYQDLPVTVLIDDGSASASEIFAGAMQDNDRGRIVGRRSFGKGLVQEPLYFTDGSGLRITIARFYTPSGRCIQKPYSDYAGGYDLYNRYMDGELFSSDHIKVDTTDVHYTLSGRVVYGGGGIIPDVFVPLDTTRASAFYVSCNRKATMVRFASSFFDAHKKRLSAIDSYAALDRFFATEQVEQAFLRFAQNRDGLVPAAGEWAETASYMLPQLRSLIGRYSRLGENAFYKYYAEIDDVIRTARQPEELTAQ